MGGSGSGQWYRGGGKPTEQNFWRLPVKSLSEYANIAQGQWSSGTWSWSRNGEVCSRVSYEINTCGDAPWMRVYYSNQGSGKSYDYKIYLTTTRPRYGGVRWWFRCPAQGCGRRVGVLYLAHIFACRHCCNMAYSTQNENRMSRLLTKAQKIHRQLGGVWAEDGGAPPKKPKGMHWKTYNRKVETMIEADNASFLGMAERLGFDY